jgi:23S rRNA pseudouridine2604 synthase
MSEGLIFLTNDGDIVNDILRARYGHEKEYHVTVNAPVTPEFVQKMSSGVAILDTVTMPCEVEATGKQAFKIILKQGLNRQIRRMCEELGYRVRRLKRVRIMNVELGDLPVGTYRPLDDLEMRQLREQTQGAKS